MLIKLRVVPNAKKIFIKEEPEGLKVYLTAPAVEGKANKALIQTLSEYYRVRKSRIEIIKGLTSRDKTVALHPD